MNSNLFQQANPATNFGSPNTWSISNLLTGGTGFSVLNLIFFLIALGFIVNLFIVAFGFISANGDPKIQSAALGRLTNSLLGLGITFAAFIIVNIFAGIFNLSSLVPF